MIDWSENAEIRRIYESNLLHHAWETLLVCSPEEKDTRRDTVWRIARGMVVLNIPDELSWTICVDWKDFEAIGMVESMYSDVLEMYGKTFIQDLVRTIPQAGLAKVLSAYMHSELSSFPPETPIENGDGGDEQETALNVTSEEILDDMIV